MKKMAYNKACFGYLREVFEFGPRSQSSSWMAHSGFTCHGYSHRVNHYSEAHCTSNNNPVLIKVSDHQGMS